MEIAPLRPAGLPRCGSVHPYPGRHSILRCSSAVYHLRKVFRKLDHSHVVSCLMYCRSANQPER